jgi:DNA polymerase III subunit chi
MGTVMFFHLMQSAPADTLAINAPRALAQGWRVMVRGTDAAALDGLDQSLWLKGGDESFLPHGLEGGPQDADQPVLIGLGAPVNGARVLALVDGAGATDAEITAMDRVWVLFDGNDQDRLQAARNQWKTITDAGHPAQYWSEESGKWEKKAEKNATPKNAAPPES